jgi:hypothetical protein
VQKLSSLGIIWGLGSLIWKNHIDRNSSTELPSRISCSFRFSERLANTQARAG